jgi:hypothetical protein
MKRKVVPIAQQIREEAARRGIRSLEALAATIGIRRGPLTRVLHGTVIAGTTAEAVQRFLSTSRGRPSAAKRSPQANVLSLRRQRLPRSPTVGAADRQLLIEQITKLEGSLMAASQDLSSLRAGIKRYLRK